MPIKNCLHRFQPVPLYIVLILSICYFSVQLILSHFSHALTLLMASYHMLCNIFALAGSIVTIKHNELHNENEKLYLESQLNLATSVVSLENKPTENGTQPVAMTTIVHTPKAEARLAENKRREWKTRNTFGWARIEILTMLIVCITLASLSFSLLVEALQTLVHIDHQDSMHYPVHVMILGFVGILLNGFTYLLIGGYTLHQGNFLHINVKGNVVVEPSNITVEGSNLKRQNSPPPDSDLQLKEDLKAELGKVHYRTRREGSTEFLRDISSTLFVIVCAVIVYYAVDKDHTAKFIDPILSIFSCVMLVGLSYPYMKESCLILLQTIPGSIDMNNFEQTLVTKFPQIINYHDLHIWQLSSHKYVATVHIIFQSPNLYEKTIEDVRSHFQAHSITHVTIQPEFHNPNANTTDAGLCISTECLMQCQTPACMDKVCCLDSFNDLKEVSVCPSELNSGKKSTKKHQHHHGHAHSEDHSHDGHGHGHDHAHSEDHGHDGHEHGHNFKHKSHSKHSKAHKCSKDVADMNNAKEIVKQPIIEKLENKIETEERNINSTGEIKKDIENKTDEDAKIDDKISNSTETVIANSMKCKESLESNQDLDCNNTSMDKTENVENEKETTAIAAPSTQRGEESSISDSHKC